MAHCTIDQVGEARIITDKLTDSLDIMELDSEKEFVCKIFDNIESYGDTCHISVVDFDKLKEIYERFKKDNLL